MPISVRGHLVVALRGSYEMLDAFDTKIVTALCRTQQGIVQVALRHGVQANGAFFRRRHGFTSFGSCACLVAWSVERCVGTFVVVRFSTETLTVNYRKISRCTYVARNRAGRTTGAMALVLLTMSSEATVILYATDMLF